MHCELSTETCLPAGRLNRRTWAVLLGVSDSDPIQLRSSVKIPQGDRTAMNAAATVETIAIVASVVVTMLLAPPLPSGVDQLTGS